MKAILTAASLAFVTLVYGQGTINFQNRNIALGIDARVLSPAAFGVGIGYTAELLAGPDLDNLNVVASTTFRTTSAAAQGYVNPVAAVVPGIPGGSDAVVVMRAYDGVSFDSSTQYGESHPITITLGGAGVPPGPPADLIGLQSFVLMEKIIPEPRASHLAVIGAVVLLLIRRAR